MRETIRGVFNAVTNNIDIANSLDDKINLINQNVQFNINIMWVILGVVVATSGVALYALAKMWVNKRVESELATIRDSIKRELSIELKSELKEYIKDNQQFQWASGTSVVYNNEVMINGLIMGKMSAEHLPIKLDVFSVSTNKKIEHDYEVRSDGQTGTLKISLKKFNSLSDGTEVKWDCIWLNDKIYN